jgi:hypothetical protein
MKNRISSRQITKLEKNEIFVFGSNEAGIHGAGAAKQARQWGAEIGRGFGLYGQTFAIPTKDYTIQTLPLPMINFYVDSFIKSTENTPHLKYLVTEIGCGLAGYNVNNIAPLFAEAIDCENIFLPESFWIVLKKEGYCG